MRHLQELLDLREELKTALKALEKEMQENANKVEDLKKRIRKIEEALAS